MSRIVRFHAVGEADVLKIEDLPPAAPGPGEVRLKVEAIGLNRAEAMFRRGMYLENPELPSRLGYEAAGVVEEVGPGVEGVRVGDRVSTIPAFSQGRYGVYGDWAVVPARAAAPYPATLSAQEGAAVWMAYLTAYGALLEIGRLDKSHTVLMTAGSSSVGLAALQIVRAAGARALVTTRRRDKRAFLQEMGADEVIVTDEEDLAQRTRALTSGLGADLIFDPVAGAFLPQLARAAAPGATIIEYGALSPDPAPYPLFESLTKGLTVRGYTLFEIVMDRERLAAGKRFVTRGIEDGSLRPVIDRTFPLEEIVAAHRHLESNRQKGKIVVTVSRG